MRVQEYSLNFILFSMHGPSLVYNPMDEMSRLVGGFTDLVKEECCTAMLHKDMDLSRIMMDAQSI